MTTSHAIVMAVLAWVAEGRSYDWIAKKASAQFGTDYTAEAIRSLYRRNKHLNDMPDGPINVAILKESARLKKANSVRAKENKALVQHFIETDSLLEQISDAVKGINKVKFPKIKLAKKAGRSHITAELMLTDWHIGKWTDQYNLEVARTRLRTYMQAVLSDFQRKSAHYNLERIVVFFGGDLLESSTIHAEESLAGCEFQNPEQMRQVMELAFCEVLIPLAALSIPIHVIGVEGNHDRQGKEKTFNKPGKNSLLWPVYHALRMMGEAAGMKQITWDIPESSSTTYDLYGDTILYTHGDKLTGGSTRDGFVKHLDSKSRQLGKLVKGMRLGHFHFYYCQDSGQVIINASLSGQDSYSEEKGYNSKPGQVVNYYVNTKNRDCSFYHSFLVQLS